MNQPKRFPLAFLPTPLEYVKKLSDHFGGPNIFIKRDDLTGLAFGGNKTRKLEYIISDMKKRGIDTVVTTAGIQSNWARQTAAAARKADMKAVLILRTAQFPVPTSYDGNLLLDYLLDADVRVIKAPLNSEMLTESADDDLFQVAEEYRKKGFNPEVINITDTPLKIGKFGIPISGGDGPVSTIGYVKAAEEIINQMTQLQKKIDYVVITTGLGGSYSGVLLGLKANGKKTKVIGIDCGAFTKSDAINAIIKSGNGAAKILNLQCTLTPKDVDIHTEYNCGGYGKTSKQLIDIIKQVAKIEGILLDPVYTGKGMFGLISLINAGYFKKSDNVVFIHTGGLPSLFPYRDIITDSSKPVIL